jgi:hypothetical protein
VAGIFAWTVLVAGIFAWSVLVAAISGFVVIGTTDDEGSREDDFAISGFWVVEGDWAEVGVDAINKDARTKTASVTFDMNIFYKKKRNIN